MPTVELACGCRVDAGAPIARRADDTKCGYCRQRETLDRRAAEMEAKSPGELHWLLTGERRG